MNNIYGLTRDKLKDYFLSIHEKDFKAIQIFEWIYEKKVKKFSDMTNIKKELIEKLENEFSFDLMKIIKKEEDIKTKKYLLELADKNLIEVVLMEHDYGVSLCVSSQIGCNMGCTFCESGKEKVVRNLEVHEMVGQVLLIEEDIKKRIDSVVIMGIGEPLDNYDNVMDFIRIINDPKGLKIGARHITVSTCGLIDKMEKLSNENIQINLAISLHFADNEVRSQLMPINKVYNLDLLTHAIKAYITKTNRRISIEYVMIKGVNDSVEDALALAKLLKGLNIYVNLIPYNQTTGEFREATKEQTDAFYQELIRNKINVTKRREFGSNIKAACGQLRSNERRTNI